MLCVHSFLHAKHTRSPTDSNVFFVKDFDSNPLARSRRVLEYEGMSYYYVILLFQLLTVLSFFYSMLLSDSNSGYWELAAKAKDSLLNMFANKSSPKKVHLAQTPLQGNFPSQDLDLSLEISVINLTMIDDSIMLSFVIGNASSCESRF